MDKKQRIADLDKQEQQIVTRQLQLQNELGKLDQQLYEINRQQIAVGAA